MFEGGNGDFCGCDVRGDWDSSGFVDGCGGRGGRGSVFPIVLLNLSYSNDSPSEALLIPS